MLDDTIRVLAGDCTVMFDGTDREEYRGRVTTIVKPDETRGIMSYFGRHWFKFLRVFGAGIGSRTGAVYAW